MFSRCCSVMACFSVPFHDGTGAGAEGSSRPSPTRMPTAAWVMLLAMLHEMSVVSASTGPPGPNSGVGLGAVALEHDVARLHHHQGEAAAVRGFGGEEGVGDRGHHVEIESGHEARTYTRAGTVAVVNDPYPDVATALGTYLEIADSVDPGVGRRAVRGRFVRARRLGARRQRHRRRGRHRRARHRRRLRHVAHRARAAHRTAAAPPHRRPVPGLGRPRRRAGHRVAPALDVARRTAPRRRVFRDQPGHLVHVGDIRGHRAWTVTRRGWAFRSTPRPGCGSWSTTCRPTGRRWPTTSPAPPPSNPTGRSAATRSSGSRSAHCDCTTRRSPAMSPRSAAPASTASSTLPPTFHDVLRTALAMRTNGEHGEAPSALMAEAGALVRWVVDDTTAAFDSRRT